MVVEKTYYGMLFIRASKTTSTVMSKLVMAQSFLVETRLAVERTFTLIEHGVE